MRFAKGHNHCRRPPHSFQTHDLPPNQSCFTIIEASPHAVLITRNFQIGTTGENFPRRRKVGEDRLMSAPTTEAHTSKRMPCVLASCNFPTPPTPKMTVAGKAAARAIGMGFDMTMDCRLEYCKNPDGFRLIQIDENCTRDLAIFEDILIPSVPTPIKLGKGERMRFSSDVLTFQKMSEQFNQEASLSGRIPNGRFNAAFEFTGQWLKDSASTRALAFDGVFITLYSVELEKSEMVLSENVKQAVPTSWDPVSLAKFIQKYGTHVITGVKIGGHDVVYVKQDHSSPLQPVEVQSILKDVAENRFGDPGGLSNDSIRKAFNEVMLDRIEHGLTFMDSSTMSIYSHKEEITLLWRRRGGSNNKNISHEKWCQSVTNEPEVISMSFIPFSSLLTGIEGRGFISHAINLYLRYKPPVELLHQFLKFQLPRKWAPLYTDMALFRGKKQQHDAPLQFSFWGPKLHVNTDLVDVDGRPVTGARLYLEGKRSNRLGIHLQHLSDRPEGFQLLNKSRNVTSASSDQSYHEKVRWRIFSHISTAPVESDDALSVVTGAQFEVKKCGQHNVLFLMLQFSRLSVATILKKQEWDGSSDIDEKSGSFFTLMASSSSQKKPPVQTDINSAVYPGGPPDPQAELLRFVDAREMKRGPEDYPGFWVMSGAKLGIHKGKISLSTKYSLLAVD